ncbi:MAG: Na+/H+ antiporter NhaC family protein [Lentisphaeria bacterium]|nr:Na+/H+ antiporter NhaC family protein [Candidatus Neomarinimicrobiota bacterium]MCF7841337.1 Na+/H+ antiporter NhaC family protein [Lentisphaeria bacterium]
MKRFYLAFIFLTTIGWSQTFSIPDAVLKGVPFDIKWEGLIAQPGEEIAVYGVVDAPVIISPQDNLVEVRKVDNSPVMVKSQYTHYAESTPNVIPAWLSILPPLIAIALALLTKEMLLSLFAGIWAGVTILAHYNPVKGFYGALDTYVVESIANPGHATIILFSFGFGGLIGLIQRNGGLAGIVNVTARYAKTRRRGIISTAFMGLFVFFDDYANSLLVGNMMRPFTDKLRISREKLSYLVDSTAAPVASVGIISTWIVFAMSLLDGELKAEGISTNAYIYFLASIPFSFYAILALAFVFINGIQGRDYGPMYQAEKRALEEGKLIRDGSQPLADDSMMKDILPEKIPLRWFNAVIPIFTVVVMTVVGMYASGAPDHFPAGSTFTQKALMVIDGSDSSTALLWASFTAAVVALVLSLLQRLINVREAFDSWFKGARSMALAVMILILAWALGAICRSVMTADFIVYYTQDFISPALLPTLTFILAAAISFATGTSYGTMSILVPLIVPLAGLLLGDLNDIVFLATYAAIISGAVFGDHCSPISDTTILSSLASGADNVDHVKTQMPYALTVGGVAILFGYLPIGYMSHLPYATGLLLYILSLSSLWLIMRYVGKPVEARVIH